MSNGKAGKGSHTTKTGAATPPVIKRAATNGEQHGAIVKEHSVKLAERVGVVVLAGAGIAAVGVGAAWAYGKYFARGMMR